MLENRLGSVLAENVTIPEVEVVHEMDIHASGHGPSKEKTILLELIAAGLKIRNVPKDVTFLSADAVASRW